MNGLGLINLDLIKMVELSPQSSTSVVHFTGGEQLLLLDNDGAKVWKHLSQARKPYFAILSDGYAINIDLVKRIELDVQGVDCVVFFDRGDSLVLQGLRAATLRSHLKLSMNKG